MPIKIIRQDITKIKCDAIVNPTNKYMWPGGGADAAIHEAAGPELLDYCSTLGGLSIGEAKITPAFRLPSKYVIHTAGPEYTDGLSGERVLLRSCYSEAMKLAIMHKCKRVAFPLISSGLYGYPKDEVLKVAIEVISKYLEKVEMQVYILVYDKTAYSISRELYTDVESFVDNFYVDTHSDMFDGFREDKSYASYSEKKRLGGVFVKARPCILGAAKNGGSLESMLDKMDEGFAKTLFEYIDMKGLSDVEAYKRSNVSRKTFSKIKCNPSHKPSKQTAVSFAIGLHLNIDEATHLLSTAGIALSHAEKFDVIIEYFILTHNKENPCTVIPESGKISFFAAATTTVQNLLHNAAPII